jgi:hypothetical protein
MNERVQEIAKSSKVLGHHLQYLAKNPRDFFEFVTTKPELAIDYAQAFSAGHVLTLLSTADEQGFALIAYMIAFSPPVPEGMCSWWNGAISIQAEQRALINRTASILLEKLDNTVFITGQDDTRRGVLDQHFKGSIFSRLLPQQNLFDQLIERENYLLIGKIINLLSPKIAMRELQKTRNENDNLLALVISNICTARETANVVLNKMAEFPTHVFELLMSGFNFDVLYQFEQNSKDLARKFYDLSPGFMQRQYPITAVNYVHLTPPYTVKPAYNVSL